MTPEFGPEGPVVSVKMYGLVWISNPGQDFGLGELRVANITQSDTPAFAVVETQIEHQAGMKQIRHSFLGDGVPDVVGWSLCTINAKIVWWRQFTPCVSVFPRREPNLDPVQKSFLDFRAVEQVVSYRRDYAITTLFAIALLVPPVHLQGDEDACHDDHKLNDNHKPVLSSNGCRETLQYHM